MVRPSVPSFKQEDVLFEQDPYIVGPRSEYLPGYIEDFDPEALSVRYPKAAGRLVSKGIGAVVSDPLGVAKAAGQGVVDLYQQGQRFGGGLPGLTAAMALNQGQGMAESGQRLYSGDYGGMSAQEEEEARVLDLLTMGEALPLAGFGAMGLKSMLRRGTRVPDMEGSVVPDTGYDPSSITEQGVKVGSGIPKVDMIQGSPAGIYNQTVTQSAVDLINEPPFGEGFAERLREVAAENGIAVGDRTFMPMNVYTELADRVNNPDFKVVDPKADKTVRRYEKGGSVMSDREASEQMGDIEYEVDMQSYLHDPLSRLGFDPKRVRVARPWSGDRYSPSLDMYTMDPIYGMRSRETQAHEFRHRGLQRLFEDYFMSDPGHFKRQYGKPAFDLMVKIDKQRREGHLGKRGPVEESVHERIAEMFQRPDEFSLGTVYETSDARVFQTLADAEAYARENPGVEFRASKIFRDVEGTLETPRVKEFRDYMINKLRGEAMRDGTDAEFEAVRAIQNAASDVLVGKYATGGRVSMGLGSLGGEYL